MGHIIMSCLKAMKKKSRNKMQRLRRELVSMKHQKKTRADALLKKSIEPSKQGNVTMTLAPQPWRMLNTQCKATVLGTILSQNKT